MDSSFKKQRLRQQQERFQARGATWKGSGRPCTLEFKFDIPEKPQEFSTKPKEQQNHRTALHTSAHDPYLKEVKKKRKLQEGLSQHTNLEQPPPVAEPELTRKRKRGDTFKMDKSLKMQPTTPDDPMPQGQETSMLRRQPSSSQSAKSRDISKGTRAGSDVPKDRSDQRRLEKRERGAAAVIRKKHPKIPIECKISILEQPEFRKSKTPFGVTATTGEEISPNAEPSHKYRVPKGIKQTGVRSKEAIEVSNVTTVQTETRRASKKTPLVKEEIVQSDINHQDALPPTKKKRILRKEVPLMWIVPLEEAPRRTRIDFGLPLDSSKRR